MVYCQADKKWAQFLRLNILEQLEFKLEEILGFRNLQEKLEKLFFQSLACLSD